MPSPMMPQATADVIEPAEQIRLRRFIISCVVLLGVFSFPLYQLAAFALKSDLYSFILIIPFISAYLIWIERGRLSPAGTTLPRGWSALLFVIGAALFAVALATRLGGTAPLVDSLAYSMYSLVCLLGAAACCFLGRDTLRVLGFPLAFLIFLAPLPVAFESGFETLLQHGSSWVAHRFFDLSDMPVYREGTLFQLPGFSMQVAPECSGIRSTLALFLTSLVAGRMFLRSPWKCVLLAALVLPIALLRNGLRVFVIGELCVKVGPHMIDSWVHHQGGPLFFALSLIPFCLVLLYLYKTDRRPKARS